MLTLQCLPTIRIQRAQVSDKIVFQESPAPARFRAGNDPGARLLLERDRMQLQEVGGLAEGKGLHRRSLAVPYAHGWLSEDAHPASASACRAPPMPLSIHSRRTDSGTMSGIVSPVGKLSFDMIVSLRKSN